MIAVTLEVAGTEQTLHVLEGAERRLANLRPAFEQAADRLDVAQQEQFETAANRQPLSQATLAARRGRWGYYQREPIGGGGPLNWSGQLRGSLGEHSQADEDSLEWGSRYPIARFYPQLRLSEAAIEAAVVPPIREWLAGGAGDL